MPPMVIERRVVDGLPYYYLVQYRPKSQGGSRRQSVAYIGRLTGKEMDRWIANFQRWRALVDDEGRPKTKPRKPAVRGR